MPNFRRMSQYCIERYKENHNSESTRYDETLFVAISEDNEVQCSNNPNILDNAYRCILIHSYRALAITNWYTWYDIEYINAYGCVSYGILGDGFRLYSNCAGSFSNQLLYLEHEDLEIYSFSAPFEDKMQKVWDLYLKVKKAKSNAALRFMAQMLENDEEILESDNIADLSFTDVYLEKQSRKHERLVRRIRQVISDR